MKKFRLQDIPEEFGYLREATRRYGHLWHHEVILEFLENKTEADLQFFRDVAAEIESHNHWRDIDRWLRDAQATSFILRHRSPQKLWDSYFARFVSKAEGKRYLTLQPLP